MGSRMAVTESPITPMFSFSPERKKNDYTVDVVIGNLFALHRDSLVFLQNGCGRDRECNILPCVQSYAYRRKATCLLTTRSLR